MKTKFVAIFATILLLGGLGLGAYGFNNLDWNYRKLDSRNYIEHNYNYTADAPLTSVTVDAPGKLTVTKGDTFSFKYYDQEGFATSVVEDNGVLTFKSNYKDKFEFRIFEFPPTSELVIPEGIDLVLNAVNTTLNIDGAALKLLTIDSVNTTLTLKNLTLEALNIDSTNTNLNFTNISCKSIDINAVNITFRADKLSFDKLNIETVNVHFMLDNIADSKSLYSISVSAVSGGTFSNQIGTDPNKTITIDTVNMSGYASFV